MLRLYFLGLIMKLLFCLSFEFLIALLGFLLILKKRRKRNKVCEVEKAKKDKIPEFIRGDPLLGPLSIMVVDNK